MSSDIWNTGLISFCESKITCHPEQETLHDPEPDEDNNGRNVDHAKWRDVTAHGFQNRFGHLVQELNDCVPTVDIGNPRQNDPREQEIRVKLDRGREKVDDTVRHLFTWDSRGGLEYKV